MKQPLPRISIQGFYENRVAQNKDYVGSGEDYRNAVDGSKLTQLNLQVQLFNRKQIQKLIDFLTISKYCFPEVEELKPQP